MGMYDVCVNANDLLESLQEMKEHNVNLNELQILISCDEEGNSFCLGSDIGIEYNLVINGQATKAALLVYPSGRMIDVEPT
jgi:hypothetical protein